MLNEMKSKTLWTKAPAKLIIVNRNPLKEYEEDSFYSPMMGSSRFKYCKYWVMSSKHGMLLLMA